MKKLLALLIALVFALSGCLGLFDGDDLENGTGDEGEGDVGDDENGDAGADGNETAEENGNTPILAPEASLSANVTEGDAPLNVTFTLEGSDPEDFPLEWMLDMGDGNTTYEGDELPFEVVHSFLEAGNYTVVLNVTNGPHATAANVTIQVSTPDPPAIPQEASGEWLVGVMFVGCFGDIVGVGFPEDLDGIAYASFEIDPSTIGQEYEASVVTDTAQDSPGFAFLDADWDVIEGGFMSTAATGTIPSDAAYGVFWTCLGGLMTGSYSTG